MVHTGLAGIDVERLRKMRNEALRNCFRRMEDTRYRLELVARIRGREYINDAAGRSVNATWYALESTQGGLIWIAMGSNEECDYSRLVPPALRKVRALYIVGGNGAQMRKIFTGIIPQIEEPASMQEALQMAYYNDNEDLKVLFSPACDNGEPTEELGEWFRREVNEL